MTNGNLHNGFTTKPPENSCTSRAPARGADPSINYVSLQEVSRERFRDLLLVAFPGASEAETARKAAAVLPVSERTVRNWLAMTHSPALEIVFAIGCLESVGVFKVMEVFTRGQSRKSVLSMIVGGVRRAVTK